MNKELERKIFAKIKRLPTEPKAYEDMFSYIRNIEEEDFAYSHELNAKLREKVGEAVRARVNTGAFFELYKKTLLYDAPHNFDCYLLYLEIGRLPKDRFYQPRRRILKQAVDALQALVDDELDELFISQPPRTGKLLADDTPVLTTKGWKNHGDLKVGDMVFNPDGLPVPVLGVLPKHHTTHTVTFSDGSKIECHFRHEWKVHDRRHQETRIIETQDLMPNLEYKKELGKARSHRYTYMIELREPLEGVPVDLKVAPYALGAWLGDGTNRTPRITGVDEELFKAVEDAGYPIRHRYIHKTTGVPSVEYKGLREALRCYGMCKSTERTEKHIPEDYLIAPYEQRLELLAGLLDSDGTLNKKEHRYHFSTTEERLRDSFVDLIHTFGWRTCVKAYPPKTSSSGVVGRKTVYNIGFNPTVEIPCRVPRKHLSEFSKQRRLSIVSIEQSEPKPGNCITVLGGMYLAGRSMIPTHNTSLLMFFVTWLIGRNSEISNLYSAFSDIITKAFYNGVLEILQDPVTYKWADVFPNAKIVQTNAADETLNIDRRKRYPSLTCRSLYGTLNGACDCNGFLISDDLIGGIEEALNKDRLIAAWGKVDNNLLTRAKEKAKILWVGTRWSIIDPAGVRTELLQNDDRFKSRRFRVINLPALNDKDESNFDYDYGVGFNTEYYHQRRASFERNNDMASWTAQYMGEPIERDGALFSPGDFRFYNGVLPDGEPDRVFMAVDPAFGGGDFVAAPVCFQYGDDIYVHDVVYDDNDKKTTQPLLANAVEKYGIQAVQIEANKSTESYTEGVEAILQEKGIRINLTSKAAPPQKAKDQRIFDKAPDIREMMIFREDGKRSKAYSLFMQNVYSFKAFAKNKHDDAPDSLAMAITMLRGENRRAEIFKRFF